MTRGEARFQHVSNLLVGGTGLVYAWMRYFVEPADEFAIANHPWQTDFQHFHVLTAPLLVFACGLIWRRHVWVRVRSGFAQRRRTGLGLFACLFPMIVSGYGIQVAASETWREIWIVAHVATSVLWILSYATHQLSARSKTTADDPVASVLAAEEALEEPAEPART